MTMMKEKRGVDFLEVRTNSEVNLSAHNTIQCNVANSWEMVRWSYITAVRAASTVTALDKAVLLLLLEHGVRITEILRIQRQDLLGHGRVLIRGIKRSNDRLLYGVSYYEALEHWLIAFTSIGEIFSRFYYYRLCVSLGIKFENGGSKKLSVTHAGRHLFAESLSAQSIELATISRSMGHKSTKSTESYVKQSEKQKQKSSARKK